MYPVTPIALAVFVRSTGATIYSALLPPCCRWPQCEALPELPSPMVGVVMVLRLQSAYQKRHPESDKG